MNRIPTPGEPLIGKEGAGTQVFLAFLRSLGQDDNVTIASLTTLKPVMGARVFVIDATGGGVPCYGDGTSWRRYSNDAIVS